MKAIKTANLGAHLLKKVRAFISDQHGPMRQPSESGPSRYYDEDYLRSSIEAGKHREEVGGVWEELGRMQLDFLKAQGLAPNHTVLDIGCGCLRAGVHLIGFLNDQNYYGMDISQSLLHAGYNIELASVGLQHKLPVENLLCDGSFSFERFNRVFDFAVAQSLFTHLPINHIRVCLTKLANHVRVGGTLFATFFECPPAESIIKPVTHYPGETTSYSERDPYHYFFADLEYCVRLLPWRAEYMGDWNHPRGQMMAAFHRLPFTKDISV